MSDETNNDLPDTLPAVDNDLPDVLPEVSNDLPDVLPAVDNTLPDPPPEPTVIVRGACEQGQVPPSAK